MFHFISCWNMFETNSVLLFLLVPGPANFSLMEQYEIQAIANGSAGITFNLGKFISISIKNKSLFYQSSSYKEFLI